MDINVKVTPKAAKPSVAWEGDVLKVKVTAPADKGEANVAVVRALADFFSVPKRDIILLSGATSRVKRFRIEGV